MNKNKYLLFGLLLIFMIFFNGCKQDDKLPPTYQGMVISKSADPSIVPLIDIINQDDPFQNFDGETIEDEIRKDLNLKQGDSCDYYTEPNHNFYLIIKIYNPKEYDLLSCVVNGTRYQSYQFSNTSDYNNIVLVFNSGTDFGKNELKLTEIQYSDGSKIRELLILDNNTASYGVTYEKVPSKKLDQLKYNATALVFNVNISDPEGLIEKNGEILSAYLYDGNEIIEKKNLTVGKNEVKFEGLKADTIYQFAIATVYDLYDGVGTRLVILHKEAFRTEKIIEISSYTAGADEINFDLFINDEEEVGQLEKIELYQGKELVATLGEGERKFTGLLTATEYLLRVVYRYGNDYLAVKEAVIKTHKQKPLLEIQFNDIGKTDFTFNLVLDDPDLVSKIIKTELYLEEELQDSKLPEEEPRFSDLLSGRLYKLQVIYSYDLEDGNGEITEVVCSEVQTEALSAPEISFNNLNAGPDWLNFEILISDPDATGMLSAVLLYQGEELLQELDDFSELSFTGLEANSMYRIKAVYSYDLNDGAGKRELELEVEKPTLAMPVEITDFALINQTHPCVGQEIHARIFFENPSHVNILSLTVNGSEIPVVSGSKNYAVIIFLPETEGGIYILEITGAKYEAFGEEFYWEFEEGFVAEILIMGEIEVLGIYGEEDGIGVDDSTPLFIELKNETDYLVTELILNFQGEDIYYRGAEIEKIDKNLLKINWKTEVNDFSSVYKKVQLIGITYGLSENEVSTKPITGIETELLFLKTLEAQPVNTVEDLMNLENGYYYRLTTDLDLLRIAWVPKKFNGILDGNGYAIKNFSLVLDNQTTEAGCYGLFSDFSGIITNLELTDLYFSIKTNGKITVGAFAGKIVKGKLINIKVTGFIGASGSEVNLGGLVGEAKMLEALSNLVSLSLEATSPKVKFGGLSGYGEEIMLDGNLFIGSVSASGTQIQMHALCVGNFHSERNFLAYDSHFKANEQEIKFQDLPLATLNNLNNQDFYLETLGWSAEVWNFANLDYEKGFLPFLQ